MMLSLSTAYYQLFLSQAICVGLGAGIAFTPSVAGAASSLTNPATRAKAMGAMACGSSIGMYQSDSKLDALNHKTYMAAVGGIVYPVMFRFLVPQLGFPWTVRAIAFVVWGLYLMSFVVLANEQPKPSALRPWVDTKAFTDVPFILMCIASVCSSTAYYIPSLYLPLVTIRKISSGHPGLGFDLLTILNGASIIGRLLAGLAGAMFGPTETIAVCLVFGSIILFCWSAVVGVPGTIAWSVSWGMISGVLVALPGAFLPLFCPSIGVIGTRSGMYWVFVGLGMLIGSPAGGAIYGGTQGEGVWQLPVFAGAFMFAAATLTLYPIVYLRKNRRA
jgi:predicted MFS family arabinose efflux permease